MRTKLKYRIFEGYKKHKKYYQILLYNKLNIVSVSKDFYNKKKAENYVDMFIKETSKLYLILVMNYK